MEEEIDNMITGKYFEGVESAKKKPLEISPQDSLEMLTDFERSMISGFDVQEEDEVTIFYLGIQGFTFELYESKFDGNQLVQLANLFNGLESRIILTKVQQHDSFCWLELGQMGDNKQVYHITFKEAYAKKRI